VDDGSTDNGDAVVKRIGESRIRLLRQENRGPSAARNRGLTEARGALIAFLDADDEWKPEFLTTVVRLATKHPEAGAYGTAHEIHESNGRVYVPRYRDVPAAPWEGIVPNFFRAALWRSPMCTSAVAVRREAFDRVGGFVLRPGIGQDVELWARIALHYPIAFSWYVGATYHREARNRRCETIFTHVFASNCFEETLRGLEVPPRIRLDVEEFVAKQKLTAASRHILNGEPRVARHILRNCKTRRFRKRKFWWGFWSALPTSVVNLAWCGKRRLQTRRRLWNKKARLHA
jgi:glycosyltransferase involved in cell wall biosynthesis